MQSKGQTSKSPRVSGGAKLVTGVSLAVLAAAACLVLLSALPARPLQPEWLLEQCDRLLGLGPSLLMACLAIRLTPLLRQGSVGANRWLQRSRILTSLLAVLVLLVIPLQLNSSERMLQRQNRQELRTLSAARTAARAIAAATDPDSFRAALAQVVQPQTIPLVFDQPLSQVKAETLAGLQRSIRQTEREAARSRKARRQRFLIESFRRTATAALLCLGMAAVARH